jgi:small subunit ribosomal protein S17
MKSKTEKIEETKVGNKKRLEGVVVSTKMTDTVVVNVTRKIPHPKYGKIISSIKKFYARVENPVNVGDIVVIEETRPLSKLIRWRVIEKK